MLCADMDGWDVVVGGREAREGRGMCIHVADLLHCTTETNIRL